LLNPLSTTYCRSFEEDGKERGFDNVMDYMKSQFSPKVGTIMRALHGATPVDGASALIVCPTEMARQFSDHPIEVIGFGSSVGIPYHEVGEYVEFDSEAFNQAYKMANIDPYRDVDYMHVHDCVPYTHFMATEAGGYFRPGEAWQAILDGRTRFDGDKPISTTGGRSTMGHAWAASGGAEIAEAVRQMRGLCGLRQIKPFPEVCVVHNNGMGMHTNVVVLRNQD
jgi:acetyl-CoA C-acetyltransferase